ncbi:MAG: hypothetical protein R6X12_06360 [bacterium]
MTARARIPHLLPFVVALLATGCHHAARRAEAPITILVSGPVELDLVPRAAALVGARREQGATFWLAAGPLAADTGAGLVTEGRVLLRALEAAGADAVVLRPELLDPGVGVARRTVSGSGLHFLSGNLVDSLGEPLGHPTLVRRLGGARVGITSVWSDSTDRRFRQHGVEFLPADRAAGRTLGLMRMQSDVAGIILPAAGESVEGFDFVIGPAGSSTIPADPGRLARLDLYLRDGRLESHRAGEELLSDWPDEPAVRRLVDSLRAGAESALAASVVGSTIEARPEALTRMFIAGRLGGRDLDGFLTDRPLFRAALGPGDIDIRAVTAALEEPGRLCVFELTGWQIRELTEDRGVKLEWRVQLRQMRMAMTRRYRLAATAGFLDRHPLALTNGYEVDDEPAWRIAARLLAESGRQ